MIDPGGLDAQLAALDSGGAFVVRPSWRVVAVAGTDARRWLDDLVTAGIGRLEPGRARRSLVLTPTGRIRADVQVAPTDGTILLLQDPRQPRAVEDILAPYVLSSAVSLEATELVVVCAPGGDAGRGVAAGPPAALSGIVVRPSMLGGGFDVVCRPEEVEELRRSLAHGRTEVGEAAVEAARVVRGVARFPVDVDETSLPAEADLVESAIDLSKGCFLGQESVARLRNRGHPPRIVRSLRADGRVAVGDVTIADGVDVGIVTSAFSADVDGGVVSWALARVRWASRDGELTTASGVRLLRRESPA